MTAKSIEVSQESWMKPFIEALQASGQVKVSCELADISRNTVYKYRREDPVFRARWDEAMKDAGYTLQDEAIRRSRDGVDEPIVWQGTIIGTVKKYSDTLLIFLMKNIMPDMYGDKLTVKFTVEQQEIFRQLGWTPADAFQQVLEAARETWERQQAEVDK